MRSVIDILDLSVQELDELVAKAFCSTDIMMRPGMMNGFRNSFPFSMRSPLLFQS